ncbi:hypothetical protein ONZ45_g8869 [Pleurotus djamor]|nr:hypothetical protein ONZ45_g8869 [Pleurotus djamor]
MSVPQEELPILESLINIRNRLTALKKDRGEYIKQSDVNSLYQAVVKQVTKLNDLRDDNATYNNRVDTTLADVFSLLSLFYLTIGKTRDAPATYSQIASMKQILNHMDESGVYNETDLAPFHRRLKDLRQIVQHDAESNKHHEALTRLLERQLYECGLANKLSTVKKCLNEVLKHGGPFNPRDLYPYQLALHKIDSLRQDGKFVGVDGVIPEGQGIVMAHLNECHELVQMLKESMEEGDDDDYDDYDEDEDYDEIDDAETVSSEG